MNRTKEEILKDTEQKFQKAFGEKFRLWSEYGWWLKEIMEIVDETRQEAPTINDDMRIAIAIFIAAIIGFLAGWRLPF